MKTKIIKWGVYFIGGILVLSVASFLFTSDDIAGDIKAAQEEDAAKAEVAKKEREDKAAKEVADKKAKEDAEKAEIETQLADFSETEEYLIGNSNGAITAVNIEYTGVHYKVEVYVNEASWAVSTESEKESFATTIGTTIQNALSDTSLVDFRSALNGDIVAEGKILGGYDIKR